MRNAIIAAALLVLVIGHVQDAPQVAAQVFPNFGCTIDAVRIKDGKRQQWETPAQWNIYHTPRGDLIIGWDNVNGVLRIIGDDLQHMRVVGNVIDIDVVQDMEELP